MKTRKYNVKMMESQGPSLVQTPIRLHPSLHPTMTTQYSLALLQEYAHTLDSLPLELSRNFADLRELDAVLSSSMTTITSKIERLIHMIEEGTAPKEERFWLLNEITDEATRLNLGGDDKIRVACQAADNLKGMFGHLDQLLDQLPGFDKSVVSRKTTYPHISLKSFMPPTTSDRPSRRRGQASLIPAPIMATVEQSPVVKRKRPQQDDNLEVTLARSPRKERSSVTSRRSRAKTDRAVSPTESIISAPSHMPLQPTKRSRNAVSESQETYHARDHNHHSHPSLPASSHPSLVPINDSNTISGDWRNAQSHTIPPSAPMSRQASTQSQQTQQQQQQQQQQQHQQQQQQQQHHHHQQQQQQQNLHQQNQKKNNENVNPNISAQASDPATDAGEVEVDGEDTRTYCICNSVSYGEMIACDDENCEFEWFHLACTKLLEPPAQDVKWYCDACVAKRAKVQRPGGRGGRRKTGGGRSGGR